MLIGICGPQGAGKTTLAEALAELVNGEVLHLADPLYEMARVITRDPQFSKNRSYTLGTTELVGRKILQLLGTEVGRQVDSEIWIEHLKARRGRVFTFVPDVRFLNEAFAVDRLIWIESDLLPPQIPHASETDQPQLRAMAGWRFTRKATAYWGGDRFWPVERIAAEVLK